MPRTHPVRMEGECTYHASDAKKKARTHAVLDAAVDGRVQGLREVLVGAQVDVRVDLGQRLERLGDDLGADVMRLEQDGRVAAHREGEELRSPGVRLGEIGDVVHLAANLRVLTVRIQPLRRDLGPIGRGVPSFAHVERRASVRR